MGVTCDNCGLRYWVEVNGDPRKYVDGFEGIRYCPGCGELLVHRPDIPEGALQG